VVLHDQTMIHLMEMNKYVSWLRVMSVYPVNHILQIPLPSVCYP
jgi:hypothetical protein